MRAAIVFIWVLPLVVAYGPEYTSQQQWLLAIAGTIFMFFLLSAISWRVTRRRTEPERGTKEEKEEGERNRGALAGEVLGN